MKKLLLTSAAVCGLALVAAPAAHAEVDLEIGGYAKVYGAFVDHDEVSGGVEGNDFDFIRDTELHFTGQTTLDNGLTVGAHIEAETDNTDGDNFIVDESYVFLSGDWGRVNVGAEDGAAYLLQVAAPSADSNIDGIRQYVNPVSINVLTDGVTTGEYELSYDQDVTGKADKITYLSPVFSGFQVGLTYSTDNDAADDLEGVGTDDVEGEFGAGYEVAARYEGQMDQVGFILGAGFSSVDLEEEEALAAGVSTDDREAWNVGLDLDIGPIGVGIVYLEDNNGDIQNAANTGTVDDEEIFVIGVDYTAGNTKFGASYYDSENTNGNDGVDTTRYSVGATYTYGPGMTFNGSLGFVEADNTTTSAGLDDVEATYVVLGTQINF